MRKKALLAVAVLAAAGIGGLVVPSAFADDPLPGANPWTPVGPGPFKSREAVQQSCEDGTTVLAYTVDGAGHRNDQLEPGDGQSFEITYWLDGTSGDTAETPDDLEITKNEDEVRTDDYGRKYLRHTGTVRTKEAGDLRITIDGVLHVMGPFDACETKTWSFFDAAYPQYRSDPEPRAQRPWENRWSATRTCDGDAPVYQYRYDTTGTKDDLVTEYYRTNGLDQSQFEAKMSGVEHGAWTKTTVTEDGRTFQRFEGEVRAPREGALWFVANGVTFGLPFGEECSGDPVTKTVDDSAPDAPKPADI